MRKLKLTQKGDSLGEWETRSNYRCMWCHKRRYLNGLLLCRECWRQVESYVRKQTYSEVLKEYLTWVNWSEPNTMDCVGFRNCLEQKLREMG